MRDALTEIARIARNRPRGMTSDDQLRRIAHLADEALAAPEPTPQPISGPTWSIDPWIVPPGDDTQ